MRQSLVIAILFSGWLMLSAASDAPSIHDRIGSLSAPVTVPKSGLIGLTEGGVLEAAGIKALDPESKPNTKSFPGMRSRIPPLGGYIYTRYNILTFEHDRVVRHEIVDRISDCVIVAKPE